MKTLPSSHREYPITFPKNPLKISSIPKIKIAELGCKATIDFDATVGGASKKVAKFMWKNWRWCWVNTLSVFQSNGRGWLTNKSVLCVVVVSAIVSIVVTTAGILFRKGRRESSYETMGSGDVLEQITLPPKREECEGVIICNSGGVTQVVTQLSDVEIGRRESICATMGSGDGLEQITAQSENDEAGGVGIRNCRAERYPSWKSCKLIITL